MRLAILPLFPSYVISPVAELYSKRSYAYFGQQEAGPSVYDAMMSLLLSEDPHFEHPGNEKPTNFEAWNRLALAYVQMVKFSGRISDRSNCSV